MGLLRVAKRRGQFWPVPVVTPETAPFAVVPIVPTKAYALRSIETGDLVYYDCPRRGRVIEKYMTKVEAQMDTVRHLGMIGLEFLEVAELNKAGGIVE
jgi:hypothetical protein